MLAIKVRRPNIEKGDKLVRDLCKICGCGTFKFIGRQGLGRKIDIYICTKCGESISYDTE